MCLMFLKVHRGKKIKMVAQKSNRINLYGSFLKKNLRGINSEFAQGNT